VDAKDTIDAELLERLRERARTNGMRLAVERVNGHWRAGFVVTDGAGEAVFELLANGPDESSAVRALAELVG
jgi:hypothetical protein